jgi:hypothetical protein
VSRPTVYTARIGYQGADALDVSRKSGNELGLAFAPSWSILGPALAKRRADGLSDTDWTAYVKAYVAAQQGEPASSGGAASSPAPAAAKGRGIRGSSTGSKNR